MARRSKKKETPNPWGDSSDSFEETGPFGGDSLDSTFVSTTNQPFETQVFGTDADTFDFTGGSTSGSLKTVSAPVGILVGTLIAALAGLALGIFASTLPFLIGGWAIASVIGFGFALLYMRVNSRLQTEPFYLYQSFPRVLYGSSMLLTVVAIGVCAAKIALYVGRV